MTKTILKILLIFTGLVLFTTPAYAVERTTINAVEYAKKGKYIDLRTDAEWLGRIDGDVSKLTSSHLNAVKMIAQKGVAVNADELASLLANVSGDLSKLSADDLVKVVRKIKETGKRFDVEGFNYLKNTDKISPNNKVDIDEYIDNDLARFSQRELDLEIDPAVRSFRHNEVITALNVENQLGITLQRNNFGDWKDPLTGKVYDDVVSPTPSKYFDEQWNSNQIQNQIQKHVDSYDHPVIDFTNSDLTGTQRALVKNFILEKQYNSIIVLE